MGVAGDCSLRQALDKAQDGDTVSLPASATPYQLTIGVVDIVHAVTISGAGTRSTVIEASSDTNGMFDDADLSAAATVTIEGVTMSGGSTTGSGGALDLTSGATFDLTGDTFTNNTAQQAGGAIEVAGTTVNVLDSTIGPGDTAITSGGGLDNAGGVNGTVSVTNSTVAGDSAAEGGGISSQGNLSAPAITNLSFTTVAFNSAATAGGDLFASNTGATISAGDSIVADGQAPSGGDCNDNADGFTSNGFNVTDGVQPDVGAGCGFEGGGDVLADARLGPLQNNGGQTDTVALAAGSPAIGLVSGNEGGCTEADQLGHARSGGTVCDAGALESGNGENAPQWSVAHDFATSPQANPSPDSFGDAGVWSYMESPWTTEAPPPAPSADTLLPDHATNGCGQFAWTGASGGVPSVAYNAGGSTLTCGTAKGPAHTVVMQPSTGAYAIVAWKSPVTGNVSTAGSFESMDASNGHGATWYVENGSTTIASGTDDVGGSGAFDPAPLAVTQGQTLYFILGPSPGDDATADTTELSLTITAAPGACAASMTIDAVQVLADCVSPQGDGTFLATGHARFGDGAAIDEPGTQTPATLLLNPSSHTIAVSGGGGAGELKAGGTDVGGGTPVIHTQAVTDPVSGISGAAAVGGIGSIALNLAGWPFAGSPVTPTVYLAPTGAGGGAIADGQLTVSPWLGGAVRFGSLESAGYPSGISGQLAVQATSGGQVHVLNGGVSFKSSSLGTAGLGLSGGELSYQPSGSDWTGTAALTFSKLSGLPVHVTIRDGKLVSVSAAFACGSLAACTGAGLPTLGPLDIEDANAQLAGLTAIDYTPGQHASASSLILSGGLIGQSLADRVIAGGSFSYGLTHSFSAKGTAGFEPLYGGRFAVPAPLNSGSSAGGTVTSLIGHGDAGIELTRATIGLPASGSLRISGAGQVPPPRFPYRLLSGPLTINVHPPHINGSGPITMSVPGVIPLIGGLRFGAANARIGERSASAEAVTRRYCAPHLGCSSGLAVAVTFKYGYGGFYWKLDGHGPGGYSTHTVHGHVIKVAHGKRLVSFAVHGAGGSPRVELIAPGGRRRLTLASSAGSRNRSGALAWINSANGTEDFLVQLPRGGAWTIKRLRGPRIASVVVSAPR
jgi:hypothetical protein